MSKKKVFLLITMLLFTVTLLAANHKFTLVIDAGHGGRDQGAPGLYSKEKDLTLKYALAFGDYVERNCPDVKVIYTRKTDVFLELVERARIANKNNADLFMSFHINAVDGSRTAHGFQSYTLGRGEHTGDKGIMQNLEVAKRENSVIFLEKDYKTVYKGFDTNSAETDIMYEFIVDHNRARSVEFSRMLQQCVCASTGRQNGGSHQNNLAVLRLTSMPSCLLELGFISSPDEEAFMNSDEAVPMYVRGIFNAFMKYKQKYDIDISVPYKAPDTDDNPTVDLPQVVPPSYKNSSEDKPKIETKRVRRVKRAPVAVKKGDSNDSDKPVFKIQILVSKGQLKNDDSQFNGLTDISSYTENGMIKFTYGASSNYNEIYRLRKQILDKFPGAFIIAFKNDVKMDVNAAIKEFKANR
ncbi:N-acetylmuramoyl-L-alanine amidase family protein [Prevotella sp.]|uniref:N-acetylmuramoyl-L-alanine amidase family protein n=1 Tax=Prevotella sp. TaxID=59823 RepID=UPI002648C35C|nr:N-acetylmuramoyl-L-alanine amidase [Prevotella sp.]MDN5553060.1 N-acetylmuramoyl-L-alanine amidase [Prevotella sp.]